MVGGHKIGGDVLSWLGTKNVTDMLEWECLHVQQTALQAPRQASK